ncbi:hypothetical protein C8R45DRAFT_1213242 [Mycena sanguinolenta]|nr:hypothetical protein C8R45DRAFT_1213242 [Mycena sanguinolenta]
MDSHCLLAQLESSAIGLRSSTADNHESQESFSFDLPRLVNTNLRTLMPSRRSHSLLRRSAFTDVMNVANTAPTDARIRRPYDVSLPRCPCRSATCVARHVVLRLTPAGAFSCTRIARIGFSKYDYHTTACNSPYISSSVLTGSQNVPMPYLQFLPHGVEAAEAALIIQESGRLLAGRGARCMPRISMHCEALGLRRVRSAHGSAAYPSRKDSPSCIQAPERLKACFEPASFICANNHL